MFRIGDTIISDEIATAKFACDISRCKGACCVVGESGAPVSREEIPAVRKAYNMLKGELRKEALEAIEKNGLIQENGKNGYEITCIDERECVFVDYTDKDEAICVIQRAYNQNRFVWEKPISCHLYPVRLKKIAGMEYANFEYIPDLCSAGCDKGEEDGIYLSDFLEKALVRRYGREWFEEFTSECVQLRNGR
jgi:hypothetical protein